MFDPMSRRCVGRALCTALLALISGASPPGVGAQPPKALAGRGKFAAPVVLIVAFDEYTKLQKLKYPVASGIAFAKVMAKQGYRITFITDKGSVETVKKALGENVLKRTPGKEAGKKGADKMAEPVMGADDGAAVDDAWRVWVEDNFLDATAPTAALGLIALIGHGAERSDDSRTRETYYLAPKDDEKNGGILIQNLQRYCADRNLPITMLINACRSSSDENTGVKDGPEAADPPSGSSSSSPTTVLIMKNRGNRFGFSEEGGAPLTYWATHPGERALDVKQNMLAIMARGLEEVDAGDRRLFTAKLRSPGRFEDFWTGERATDLSFLRWFRYGLDEDNGFTKNQSRFKVELGKVEQEMIFASTEKGRLARLLGLNSSRLDLMSSWTYNTGEFIGETTERGIEITHPETAEKVLYSLGLLETDLEARGKTLLVECKALEAGARLGANTKLPVLFQPGDEKGNPLYSGWNAPIDIPYNRSTVVAIPLDGVGKGGKLNRITFSANPSNLGSWPKGATLLLTRMQLCDNDLAKQVRAPAVPVPTDLLARWWLGDVLRQEKSDAKMLASYKSVRDRLTLTLDAKDAQKGESYGRGGPVFPRPFVDKSTDVVVLHLAECGLKVNTQFEIVLHGKKKILAEEPIDVAPGQLTRPINIKLKESDFLDYIGITSNRPDFKAQLEALEVVTTGVPPKK